MSYWSSMHNKHPKTFIEAYFSVFIDFQWILLSLMAVKNLEIIFRIFF